MKIKALLGPRAWLLAALLLLCTPSGVFAKAAYSGKAEMVLSAEVIAIVDVMKVEPVEAKASGWTYNEVAIAKVDRVLKGELGKEEKLYGKENFICAQVRYKPGKHLLFLRRDGDLLVGVNWHLGVLPIAGQSVQWFKNDKSIGLQEMPLETVVREIAELLKTDWPIAVHVRHESRGPTRLKLAVWRDGTVLFATDAQNLEVGRVGHPQSWEMWDGLRKAEFFKIEREHYIVPDASYETIAAHQGSESEIHSWHGSLMRGFGGDIETDSDYGEFVTMWKMSEEALSKVRPDKANPLAEVFGGGTFRGYDLANPPNTPWMKAREWNKRAERLK